MTWREGAIILDPGRLTDLDQRGFRIRAGELPIHWPNTLVYGTPSNLEKTVLCAVVFSPHFFESEL